MTTTESDLKAEIKSLQEELEEYKDLVEGIRNGGVDALAINKNGRADIFSLESTDFVYRVLIENFAEGALNISDKGLIVYANPAFERLLGSNNVSVMGMDLNSLIDQPYKKSFQKLFQDSFSGTSKGEIGLINNDKRVLVEVSLSSLYPRYPGIGISVKDLSETRRKEAEIQKFKRKVIQQEGQILDSQILQKSIEKFRFMGDTVPQKVWTADVEGKLDYFNRRWLEYTDLPLEALKGWKWKQLVHTEDWPETERVWVTSLNTGEVFEIEHRLRDSKGIYRWHLSRALAQLDEGGDLIMWVGTTTDIHEQKNFSQELEKRVNEATVFLQTIFDSSEEIITSFDREFIFTSVNKAGAEIVSMRPDQIVGKSIFTLFPELLNGQYHKTLIKVFDGAVVHEKEVITVKGQESIFDTFYKPLIIEDEVRGILIVSRDITQLVSVTKNLQKTKKQLEQQFQKIKRKNDELVAANIELVSFTHIASHDLQEPLRKIRLFSKLITDRHKAELSPGAVTYFDRIESVANHMQKLLESLLSYSRVNHQQYVFEHCDLNMLMNEVAGELSHVIAEKTAVLSIGPLPSIPAIHFQIKQVFANLISNSLKFAREKIPPVISISTELVKSPQLPAGIPDEKESYWKISVSDNGIGFDAVYESKVFELFQQLHARHEYEGTGIGLSICKKVIQNHHGLIFASGQSGIGCTIEIYLPLTQPDAVE